MGVGAQVHEHGGDKFVLGRPALVCRWRLASGELPLRSRHLRALARRQLADGPVSPQLVAWAQQHIEWTLKEGSVAHPDGVLMLVIDEGGRAAMTVGPYEPLPARDAAALGRRARLAAREAEGTGVAPETLWVLSGDSLLVDVAPGSVLSGAASLVADLSSHLGLRMERREGLEARLAAVRRLGRDARAALPREDTGADGVFLASDEHGVVVADDAPSPRAQRFADAYRKLLSTYDGKGSAPRVSSIR